MTSLFEGLDVQPPTGSARMSGCGLYRYEIRRRWGAGRPFVVVALNPSVANDVRPDPTLTRCVGFAKREGCEELIIINLYAYISDDPKKLLMKGNLGPLVPGKRATREIIVGEWAIGPENNHTIASVLVEVANRNGIVVAAWGSTDAKLHAPRVAVVRKLIGALPVWCLGVTKDGSPRHPCRLSSDAPLVSWSPQ